MKSKHPELAQFKNKKAKRYSQLFDEFVESYHGDYEFCLENGSYLEELIHWMHYHRWIQADELYKIFNKGILRFINFHFTYKKGLGIDRIINIPYSCHPDLFKR